MAVVKFEVELKARTGWIAVDDKDVQLSNDGKGSVDLKPGKHVLVWWLIGDAGDYISIVGKAGQREVVKVEKSKIPPGEVSHSYPRRFEV